MRVAITGSTGLIGTALTARLRASGAEVVRLVRRPPAAGDEVRWDPAAADGGLSRTALRGVDAVVHLSGAPMGLRWTAARKQLLRSSRVSSTSALVGAMLAADEPPRALLSASGVDYYGDTGNRAVDEAAPPAGTWFLAALARDWEAAAEPASAAGIRVTFLRSGVVLSRDGGILRPLLPAFRLGLGTRIGPGTQYLSWISLTDHLRAIQLLLGRPDITGPVNLTAPSPATNAEFTQALAAAVHRPALLAAPAVTVRLALGELAAVLLGSSRVLPARLQQAGFSFEFPTIGPALADAVQHR